MRPARINKLKKFVWTLSNTTLPRGNDLIKGYLQQVGWIVLGENERIHQISLIAKNPKTSFVGLFKSGEPQVSRWSLTKNDDVISIEMSFEFHRKFSSVINRTLSMLIVFSFICLFLGNLTGILADVGRLSYFAASFAAIAILYKIYQSKEYEKFLGNFYSYIYHETGQKIRLLSEAAFLPKDVVLTLYGGAWIVSFLIILGVRWEASKFSFSLVLIIIFWGIFWVTLIMAIELIVARGGMRERLRGYFPGMIVGVFMAHYALIPIIVGRYIQHSELMRVTVVEVRLIGAIFAVALVGLLLSGFRHCLQDFYSTKMDKGYVAIGNGLVATSALFSILVFSFWAMSSVLSLGAIYLAISGLGQIVVGQLYFFHNAAIEGLEIVYGRLGVVLYSVPPLAILVAFVHKDRSKRARIRQSRRASKELVELVDQIFNEANIQPPHVVVDEKSIIPRVSFVPATGSLLWINPRILKILDLDQLRGVLAHEGFHLKRHSRIFALLDWISEWTLFGHGFLVIALDTGNLEYGADQFATDFLRRKRTLNESKEILVSALETLIIEEQWQKHLARSQSRLGFGEHDFGVDEAPRTFTGKVRWLYEVYFGDKIISYLHPTLEERIERIEAMV